MGEGRKLSSLFSGDRGPHWARGQAPGGGGQPALAPLPALFTPLKPPGSRGPSPFPGGSNGGKRWALAGAWAGLSLSPSPLLPTYGCLQHLPELPVSANTQGGNSSELSDTPHTHPAQHQGLQPTDQGDGW